MKVGQKVWARFKSLPNEFAGHDRSDENKYRAREGVIVYIHPKWRYITLATRTEGGTIKESFLPMDIIRKEK